MDITLVELAVELAEELAEELAVVTVVVVMEVVVMEVVTWLDVHHCQIFKYFMKEKQIPRDTMYQMY